MTDDFDAAVLTAKNDRQVVPAKLRAKQSTEWDEIATRAETPSGLIERDNHPRHSRTRRQLSAFWGQIAVK